MERITDNEDKNPEKQDHRKKRESGRCEKKKNINREKEKDIQRIFVGWICSLVFIVDVSELFIAGEEITNSASNSNPNI